MTASITEPTPAPRCEWAYRCPKCDHLLMFCTCVSFPPAFPDAPLSLAVTAEGITAWAMHKARTEIEDEESA